MVSQVGFNTSISAQPMLGNNAMKNPLQNLAISGNDYSNDCMAIGLNFSKMAENLNNSMPITTGICEKQQPPISTQPTMTGQPETPQAAGQPEQVSTTQEPTAINDTKKGPKAIKYIVGGTGLLAPIVGKIISGIKTHSVKTALKNKSLWVSCPVLALVGFGIGALLEKCIQNKKASTQEATETA